jgi:NADPH:quinone reductase-like Zn-dependent oxidoreductase
MGKVGPLVAPATAYPNRLQLETVMHAYRIFSGRNEKALERFELDVPTPTAREVLIRVRAVSLNYRDLMIERGDYPVSSENPPIAGADGAGDVVAVGGEVTRFRVGDRVAGIYFANWIDGEPTPEKLALVPGASMDGMLAEEVVVHEDFLVAVPPHLSFNEAATLPCAGVTAWNAIFVEGRVRPGNTVLLLGTGGVSIWGLQLAKAAGLRTIITSSSDDKLRRARALGADEIINYRTQPEWQNEVLRLTQGRGVDLAIEVGGHGTLNRSVAATRVGGTVALVGGVSGFAAELQIPPLLVGAKRVTGIGVGSRVMFDDLNRFMAAAGIRPVIDRVFGFDQAREAYAYLRGAGHFGKIVISVSE